MWNFQLTCKIDYTKTNSHMNSTNALNRYAQTTTKRTTKLFYVSQAFNNNTQRPARNPEQAQNPNTPNSVAPSTGVYNRFGSDDDDDSPAQTVANFVCFFRSVSKNRGNCLRKQKKNRRNFIKNQLTFAHFVFVVISVNLNVRLAPYLCSESAHIDYNLNNVVFMHYMLQSFRFCFVFNYQFQLWIVLI